MFKSCKGKKKRSIWIEVLAQKNGIGKSVSPSVAVCVETEGEDSDNLDLPLEALINDTVVSVDALACIYIASDHFKSFTLRISIFIFFSSHMYS